MSKFTNFTQDVKTKKLLSVTIGLLNKCPSKCVYCRKYTYPDVQLDLGRLFNTIAYLKSQGLQTITFSGGDPLMYPHIVEVLRFCKTLDIQTSMITTLIPTKYLEDVAKLCTRIHTSVDSADREEYKMLRGVDALDIVEKNLIKVNSIRKSLGLIPVRISSVISNKNYNNILTTYDFAVKTGSTLNYYFVHTYEEYFLNNKEMDNLLNILNVCKDRDNQLHISNAECIINDTMSPNTVCKSGLCKLPYITCEIAPDGLIYPCCNLYDENAEYNSTRSNAYGTIYADDLEKEFAKRFDISYGINAYCKKCVPHLMQHIDEINSIIDNDSNLKLFI